MTANKTIVNNMLVAKRYLRHAQTDFFIEMAMKDAHKDNGSCNIALLRRMSKNFEKNKNVHVYATDPTDNSTDDSPLAKEINLVYENMDNLTPIDIHRHKLCHISSTDPHEFHQRDLCLLVHRHSIF